MLCGSCGGPIRDGEPYTTYEHHSASAGGDTVHFHAYRCRRAPHQGTQDWPIAVASPEPPRKRRGGSTTGRGARTDSPLSPWPVPPPFMWECAQCTDLLQLLIVRADSEPGCFSEQLHLAKHIVAQHPDEVPASHGANCSLCTHYAKHGDAGVWEEHRARGLFMPTGAARLM